MKISITSTIKFTEFSFLSFHLNTKLKQSVLINKFSHLKWLIEISRIV